jgi:hypothetical protein
MPISGPTVIRSALMPPAARRGSHSPSASTLRRVSVRGGFRRALYRVMAWSKGRASLAAGTTGALDGQDDRQQDRPIDGGDPRGVSRHGNRRRALSSQRNWPARTVYLADPSMSAAGRCGHFNWATSYRMTPSRHRPHRTSSSSAVSYNPEPCYAFGRRWQPHAWLQKSWSG